MDIDSYEKDMSNNLKQKFTSVQMVSTQMFTLTAKAEEFGNEHFVKYWRRYEEPGRKTYGEALVDAIEPYKLRQFVKNELKKKSADFWKGRILGHIKVNVLMMNPLVIKKN